MRRSLSYKKETGIVNPPLVSIITVCRNADKTIARAMQSVAEQTYAPIEYIVVDGGSTDRTLDMIKCCPVVTRWISEPDNGIADAFNKGIVLATGEWVGILNADDWYEPETAATVIGVAGDADVVHGPVRYWDGDMQKEVFYPNQEALCREMTINHQSVFVRRSVYEALGGFDMSYRYAMDYELLLRIRAAGYRFYAVADTVLANMRLGGVSDIHWQAACREVMRAKDTHFPSFLWNKAYYALQVMRGNTRRSLEVLGMRGIIMFVRRYLSVMRKR